MWRLREAGATTPSLHGLLHGLPLLLPLPLPLLVPSHWVPPASLRNSDSCPNTSSRPAYQDQLACERHMHIAKHGVMHHNSTWSHMLVQNSLDISHLDCNSVRHFGSQTTETVAT